MTIQNFYVQMERHIQSEECHKCVINLSETGFHNFSTIFSYVFLSGKIVETGFVESFHDSPTHGSPNLSELLNAFHDYDT